MFVFTYHEDLLAKGEGQNQLALIELWKKSWRAHGWNPIVLGEEDAKKHPLYEEISNSEWLRKSTNGWGYTRACHMRWLAYLANGHHPLFHSDYDVINYGFMPQYVFPFRHQESIICYDHGYVPCVVYATNLGLQNIVRLIVNTSRMRAFGPLCVADDLNDMNLIRDFLKDRIVMVNEVHEVNAQNWNTANLIHYTTSHVPQNKVDFIRKNGPPLGFDS